MKKLVLTICCMLVLFSSTAVAIMGPPVATLRDGRFEFGVGFSKFDFETAEMPRTMTTGLQRRIYSEWTTVSEGDWVWVRNPNGKGVWTYLGDIIETDSDRISSTVKKVSDLAMKGFDTSTVIFRYSGGVYDHFNLDLYLGGSELNSDGMDRTTYVCGGVGGRMNFYQKDRLTIGTSIQWRRFGWKEELDDMIGSISPPISDGQFTVTEATWRMNYNKWMFAVGPAYEVVDGWTVYAGPYYSIVKGKIEITTVIQGEPVSWDDRDEYGYGQYGTRTLSGESKSTARFNADGFGIVFGTIFVLNERLATYIEADLTKDNSTLGASIAYRF